MTTLNAIYPLILLMAVMGMLIYSLVRLDLTSARLQPKAIPVKSSEDVVEQIKKSDLNSFGRTE
jgi:hypothetical protein